MREIDRLQELLARIRTGSTNKLDLFASLDQLQRVERLIFTRLMESVADEALAEKLRAAAEQRSDGRAIGSDPV